MAQQISLDRFKYWGLFFILILCAEAMASVVHRVRIQGQKEITLDAIRGQIRTRANRRLRSTVLTEDVKRLYNIGYFSHILVDSYRDSKNRLIITFKVKEKPRVRSIIYKGHSSLTKKKLEEMSNLKEYEFLNIKKLKTAIEKIKNHYKEKGYLLAQISYSLKEDISTQKVDVIIKIKEGEKALIQKISFIGNKNISSSYLKSFLSHKEKNIFSLLSDSGMYKEENLSKDAQVIKFLYMEQGYMDVYIDEPQVALSPAQDGLYITFSIREGSKFKVGNIDFSGDIIFPKLDLQRVLSLKQGDVFVYSAFQKDLIALQNKYGDEGYAFANMIPRFASVDDEIHILFQVEKGKLTSINQINIVGNNYTRDKVIRREIKIYEGEFYKSSLISKSQQSIQHLGYFDNVSVLSQPVQGQKSKVDLEFLVKERETYGEFGGGISYRQNEEGLFSFKNIGINASLNKQNIFGLGQTISGRLNFNLVTAWVNAQYIDPHIFDSDWYFSFDFFYENSEFSQFLRTNLNDYLNDKPSPKNVPITNQRAENDANDSQNNSATESPYPLLSGRPYIIERKGFQFALGYWLKDQWKILPKIGLIDMRMQELTESLMTGLGSSVRESFQLDASEGLRVLLGGSVEYNGKNDVLFPTSGLHTRFSSDYIYRFARMKFSGLNLFKIDLSVSHYANIQDLFSNLSRNLISLKWSNYLSNVTLKNKIQYGSIYSLGSGESFIPVDLLYLLGGPVDLRGYSLLSVGKTISIPRAGGSSYSIPYGGAQQLVYNLELQLPILLRNRLYGLLFFDIGQADDHLIPKIFKRGWNVLKKNVGIGVSWASPLGPVHLKLGFPIEHEKDFFKDKEFHFNIGYDF